MEKKDALISYLLKEKIVKKSLLDNVLEKHKKTGQSLITILKEDNLLDEEQLTQAVANTGGIEFINLAPEMVDPMVAHLIPYDIANKYNAIPIKRQAGQLKVAMSSPLNLSVRDQIEMKTGYKVIPLAATPSAIRRAIQYHFDITNVTKQAIVSMRLEEQPSQDSSRILPDKETEKVNDSPIAKLVSSIINGAIDTSASDIHIEPQDTDIRIRYRIDGTLRSAVNVPLSVQQEMISHIKIMANMDISERRIPQDGHISTKRNNQDFDLRISSLPAIVGEKIVIRILNKDVDKWSIDHIVSSSEDNQKFKEILKNPYGMFLMTGPTGCGKTTTLYAMLQLLNTIDRNIVTVEDPVEYRLPGITQVQVQPIAGRTFASALRSILRQDPDIILIGEIRDAETAEIAVSASLTGHLVLSTLHTNDAAGAISRLTNLGIQPFLAASALIGTVAQRLMRVTCSKCKQPYDSSKQDIEYLFGKSSGTKKIKLYKGQGCDNCYNTGYHGRKSIYEILQITPEIRKLIINKSSDQEIKEMAINNGMKTLHESAVQEIINGVTTTEELTRIVDVGVE